MSDKPETKNAIITDICIMSERGFILTVRVDLKYDETSRQGFGGWALGPTDDNSTLAKTAHDHGNICGVFLGKLLRVCGVDDLMDGVGKAVRVRASVSNVHAIGHIIEDIWLDPEAEFSAMKKARESRT